MNNSSEVCLLTEDLLTAQEGVVFFYYYIGLPMLVCLGLAGTSVSLVIYFHEFQSKPAFIYQIQLAITETCAVIFGTTFVITYRILSGGSNNWPNGFVWFQKNYTLMWFTAHLAPVLAENVQLLILLLTVAATGDRFHAIVRPANYSSIINKRFLPSIALCISLMFCVFVAVPDCFFNKLYEDGDRYRFSIDENNPIATLISFTQYTRNAVELGGTGLLIMLNLAVLLTFRRRRLVTVAVTSVDKKRRRTERLLLMLTVSQSLFTFLPRVFNIIYETTTRLNLNIRNCYAGILGPLLECTMMICLFCNFYFNMVVSKRFRTAVVGVLVSVMNKLCKTGVLFDRSMSMTTVRN